MEQSLSAGLVDRPQDTETSAPAPQPHVLVMMTCNKPPVTTESILHSVIVPFPGGMCRRFGGAGGRRQSPGLEV